MLKCKMIKPLAKIIVATGIIIGLLFPGITSFAEKTETVYVITQRSDERTDPVKYTYNPNGLIQSYTNTFEDQVVFKYQNGKLTKKADGKGHESKENTIYREEYLYNYNSRGWLMSSQRNSFETITTTGESTQSWEKLCFKEKYLE